MTPSPRFSQTGLRDVNAVLNMSDEAVGRQVKALLVNGDHDLWSETETGNSDIEAIEYFVHDIQQELF